MDPSKLYTHKKKRWFNKLDENIIAIQQRYKSLRKLKDDLDFINSDDDSDTRMLDNVRFRIAGNINIISPADRIELFGTDDVYSIVNELSNVEQIEKCSDWLTTKIGELIKAEMSIKTSERQANIIQERYSDNPKKTLDNFIFNKPKPSCQIDEQSLFSYFSNSFKQDMDEFFPDIENGIFTLTQCFDDDDKEDFMNCLNSPDLIKEVIKSRKFNSAAGPDGIDYSIFKLSIDKATSLIHDIMNIIIKAGRVPSSWKMSTMNLIFKKGDQNDPANWRPISISNSTYRIISCIFAKTINKFNKKLQIFSPNQKGFLESINGCADNANVISELFYDAMRTHRSLYITALDFKNAFGSVHHKAILQCLKEKGFPEEFQNLIENIYTGSTTRICTNNFTSKPIDVKKGSKQGCPVSPLLFNLCLEPLLMLLTELIWMMVIQLILEIEKHTSTHLLMRTTLS